ncbi:MAG: hypothetical protein HC848_10695 [Limnobacter sp.]|nr:hypothetical protein [Limnobacter sp.]
MPECSTFDNALNATLEAVGLHNAAQNGGTKTLFLPMAFRQVRQATQRMGPGMQPLQERV